MGKLEKQRDEEIIAEMQAAYEAQQSQGSRARFSLRVAASLYDTPAESHTGLARDDETVGRDRPLGQAVPRTVVDNPPATRILEAMSGGMQPHTDDQEAPIPGRRFVLRYPSNRRTQRGHDNRGGRSSQNHGGRR